MDRANNLMVVDSLMFLEGPIDWDRLVDVGRRRMVDRYPVFRQRPVMPLSHVGPPHWEDDPDFDLDRHVFRARLDGGDDAAVQRYVAKHLSRPLDRSRPCGRCTCSTGTTEGRSCSRASTTRWRTGSPGQVLLS
jgi:hypothetical protein